MAAAVVQKIDDETAKLEEEEKRIAALEAELSAAEARVEAAEARYQSARKQVAEELAKPLEETAAKRNPGDAPGLPEVEAKLPSEDIGPEAVSRGSKNTSAKTDKQASSDKWMAKKSAEGRVRNQAKKVREKMRRNQRDQRSEFAVVGPADGEEAPAPAESKPAAPERERNPLFESEEIKQGAASLAERLACLKDRPNPVEKRAAALKVLTGGRENYFSMEPRDVLLDLEKRGLVEGGLATELGSLLEKEVAKTAPVPKEEWLDHAQKVSGLERKDDEPFKESEVQYLKWTDRVGLVSAEAELDAAQRKLEDLLKHVDDTIPEDAEEVTAPTQKRTIAADQAIDEDYAAQLEDKYDPDRQSKGSKNASAVPDKVASHEKWVAERGAENRELEKNVKARDEKRGGARDAKGAAAEVDA